MSKETFQWDDERVMEFYNWAEDKYGQYKGVKWDSELIQEFKRFKIAPTASDEVQVFTEKEKKEAEKKAFNAGRERDRERPIITTYPPNGALESLTLYADKYPTFQDYKNAKP